MITDYFNTLTDILKMEYEAAQKVPRHGYTAHILSERLLKPFLPSSIRHSTGLVLDIKERSVGPFDVVAALDHWPPVGQGEGSLYMAEGVVFCLSAKDWAKSDLTQYAQMAKTVKSFERKASLPIQAIAFSYTPLEVPEVLEFLKSNAGDSVDAVFSLGNSLVIRNAQGWYGDPQKVPFVTEKTAGPALKFFAFYLLQIVHAAQGIPFGWADYQHL